MFAIETMNHTAFNSKVLEKAATEIRKAAIEAGQKSLKVIYLIGQYNKEAATDSKFASALSDTGITFCEWAEQAFGFARSTTYQFIKMAYIITEKKEKNKTIYTNKIHDIITDDESGRFAFAPVLTESDCEFTIAQLMKMIPPKNHDWNDIAELVAGGDIRPSMSCREIIEAMKQAFSEKKEPKEDKNNSDNSTDNDNENSTDNEVYVSFTLDGKWYSIPESIMKKYEIEEPEEPEE